MFTDEPLSDLELFQILRDSFNDDESTWEVVSEAQEAYKDLRKRIIQLEIEEEKEVNEIYNKIWNVA
ncbi:MAG: hypothetical protein JWO09_877 [Bacteroidetes bacterium]|nr:hypothetical protein [Bacteroidota bacterium]